MTRTTALVFICVSKRHQIRSDKTIDNIIKNIRHRSLTVAVVYIVIALIDRLMVRASKNEERSIYANCGGETRKGRSETSSGG